MSVEVEISAPSMSESFNSLGVTPLPMHRLWIEIGSTKVWYKIIAEANREFGIRGWRGQSGVKRRLDRLEQGPNMMVVSPNTKAKIVERIWFDVPDEKFATWIAIKYAVTVIAPPGK
jgi:hypothetical protein